MCTSADPGLQSNYTSRSAVTPAACGGGALLVPEGHEVTWARGPAPSSAPTWWGGVCPGSACLWLTAAGAAASRSKMALRPGAGASGAAGAGAGPGGAGRWVGGAGRGTGGAGKWVGGMGKWGRAQGRRLRDASVLGTRGERTRVQAPPHLPRGLERPRVPSRLAGLELLLERRL